MGKINFGNRNPYKGEKVPLFNLYNNEKPGQLKSVEMEILDRKGVALSQKLSDWKPLDYKSALLFLPE